MIVQEVQNQNLADIREMIMSTPALQTPSSTPAPQTPLPTDSNTENQLSFLENEPTLGISKVRNVHGTVYARSRNKGNV